MKEKSLVSPSGDGETTMRVAHFLQPTVTSIEGPMFELPAHCLSSLPHTFEPKHWPLKLALHGCTSPKEDWKIWVGKMASLHEAILNSTYSIQRNHDLVLGLAEKWCPETKSFIFSWGEATLTLEDMIISGYSVLGSLVFSQLETENFRLSRTEFDWCPYAKTLKNWSFAEFYAEKEMWISVDPGGCEELESLALCLRISELNGCGYVEHYFPHRVAMQFGLDQDLPAGVAQVSDYNATGSKTDIPSHDMERSQGVEGDGNERETEIQELQIEDRIHRLRSNIAAINNDFVRVDVVDKILRNGKQKVVRNKTCQSSLKKQIRNVFQKTSRPMKYRSNLISLKDRCFNVCNVANPPVGLPHCKHCQASDSL
ncbi:hypothetical protein Dsin_023014 [Dipteronia sinensis]|uniref:Aminotransferase-like plant mobile domain-containing protein n=1 Tax=Dipteronia sinensis TaxID=43782 RepID=A0AAE0E0M6_9ROSI|nr:hypothetical protein Dsin_023014 [Dipteronia sinensis]